MSSANVEPKEGESTAKRQRLEQGSQPVVIMDGGMGRELLNMGVPQRDGLWSATSIVEEQYHPQVIELHERFIKAGARTITTNNYAIQPMYYSRAFPEDWEERMVRDTEKAAELACKARDGAGVPGVLVLGSLPPLVDNHRPDLFAEYIKKNGEAAVIDTYATLSDALLRGGADVFLTETFNSWSEVRLVVEAIKKHGKPVWVSLSGEMRNMNLDDCPETSPAVAEEVLAAKKDGAMIEMLSFNCAQPEKIISCIEALKKANLVDKLREAGIHLGVYANCCDFVREKNWDVRANPQFRATKAHLKSGGGYVKFARRWCAMGVTHIGGCCGCTPPMIQEVAEALQKPDNDAPDDFSPTRE